MDQRVHRKPWQRLFERLLCDWDERESADWDNADTRLASRVYTDPARYESERAMLFYRLPLCLGHEDQLSAGSVLARDVAGQPLLLTRGRDGEVRVFSQCLPASWRAAGAGRRDGVSPIQPVLSVSRLDLWSRWKAARCPVAGGVSRAGPRGAWTAPAAIGSTAWPDLGCAGPPPPGCT